VTATLGDDDESMHYRAVLETFAPDTELAGFAGDAYTALLNVIRGVNATGIDGEVTADSVAQALHAAREVPLANAVGATFTCDGTTAPEMPSLCTASTVFGRYEGTELGQFEVIDGGPLFRSFTG
jgi:branched-chain amino acid transport system substrate-binding protein